jgi:hypothetical protein
MNHQNTSCGLTDNADAAKALCIATTRPQRLNTLREQSRRRNPIRNWSAIQANDPRVYLHLMLCRREVEPPGHFYQIGERVGLHLGTNSTDHRNTWISQFRARQREFSKGSLTSLIRSSKNALPCLFRPGHTPFGACHCAELSPPATVLDPGVRERIVK